jgi:hypothetical protein
MVCVSGACVRNMHAGSMLWGWHARYAVHVAWLIMEAFGKVAAQPWQQQQQWRRGV